MVQFEAKIHQFETQGEKTGWTYIEIPADIANELLPGNKKSFRVKGKLDAFAIKGVALLPMGGGTFIMALNASMRKGIHKKKGGMVKVQLTVDKAPLDIPPAFLECLADEPGAEAFFNQLKQSQRNYFVKWLGGVKSDVAVAKRIAQAVDALARNQDFVMMIRAGKVKGS
ncbi:MAG: hypothetical protein NVSMB63_16360 [Sediminibacterium sp.]